AAGGYVLNNVSGEKLSYGQLVSVASQFDVPQNPRLKNPAEFRLIGKPLKRLDVGDKVSGKAQYGIDTFVEGMVYACILHAPVLHSKVKAIDEKRARSIGGVLDIIRCERPMPHTTFEAVAVVASNYWSALQGRKALDVTWEHPVAETDSENYVQRLYAATKTNGPVHAETGGFDEAFQSSESKLTSVYESQFLAHAPMEPENALAHVKADGTVEVWVPYQSPNWAKREMAKFLQIDPERVKVNITLLGGSFGRKSYPDFLLEACLLSKLLNKPVKLIWSREDDISQGPYRPAMLSHLKGITNHERITGMHHHAIGETFGGQVNRTLVAGLPDASLCGEISFENSKYLFTHTRISHTRVTTDIPIMWWRSVWGANFAWGQECFFDELAHQMRIDPLQARLDVLNDERYRNVLNVLAAKCGYYDELPTGSARGIAMWKCFGSISAACVVVVKASIGIKVQRVTSVLDCGLFVNEDTVKAQMEGNVIMGLSSATGETITFTKGRCNQNNFHQYPLLRIRDVPVIETHIIAQGTSPGGVGEPGLPPIAPALGNALFNLTGKRIRKLPVNLKDIELARS
ncbi:MAG TPA: molybdopterin cofactor-binding domain-containing protein, partial [Chryseolinea sp.]|nr:molybdopterin cofactor-binding domain-containing protein [Chryseolinea sp.]